MSQSTEVKDTSATANSTSTRDANGDSNFRRIGLPANAGGLDNLGYERGGVYSTSATATLNPDGTVNGALVTVNAAGAAKTINLPAAATWPGLVYEVKKTDSSVNAVTVDPNGSEVIDGAATLVLYDQYESVRFRSDGTSWAIIAWYKPNETLQRVIADPGNGGAISVLRSGHVAIVTAGAETRTLAIPTFVGQEMLIYMQTDGGDGVITVAQAINQTGNNTITLNDHGDSIRLNAINDNGSLRWRVVYNDGTALSTV